MDRQQTAPVGGVFGIDLSRPGSADGHPFSTGQPLCLVNASSALFLILDELRPARVWLPSYLCEALPIAADRAGIAIEFYSVSSDLTCPRPDELDVGPEDAVVVIHYFGFRNPFAAQLSSDGRAGWVIEDASQALLTDEIGAGGDFVIYSPRKFLGLPDGGLLLQREEVIPADTELADPPPGWWLTALSAVLKRRDFDMGLEDGGWFSDFRAAQAQQPVGRLRMSDLSRTLLFHRTDYAWIIDRRRANYRQLADSLGSIALFPELPDGVVPLGFPVRLGQRDALRERLIAESVYPPIHWPIDGIVPEGFESSHQLAQEILTIPCDQRYGTHEMRRVIDLVEPMTA
jgi:dTDP-4-amino-4,6-dideoxygalactose transaminase